MNTKTTRQQILEFLESKGIASAGELSEILHVTSADIRHHLANLGKEGLVSFAGHSAVKGKGRPHKLYRLTRPVAAHNLHQLSGTILDALRSTLDPDAFQGFLADLAKIIAQSCEPVPGTAHLSQKLALSVKFLNSHHYESRWEAHKNGPQLIFQHCPYHSIIKDHPELCYLDKKLVESLLEVGVVQKAKLKLNPLGLPYCCFQLHL